MKKIISTLLIVMGIIFLLAPFITEIIIKYYSNSMVPQEIPREVLKANNENEELEIEFDFSAVEDVDIMSIIKGSQHFNKEFVIGSILIPELDINLPIMKGLSNANLVVGAATMKLEQSFGIGNYTLAGHRMKNKDLLFGKLMDIEIGNKVFISDGETVYEYEIYDTVVVPDTAMDMLFDEKSYEKGKPIVSLMTCYYSSSTEKRFFALGELVDEYPID